MSTKRIKIPHRDDLVDYGHAVAGHAGVMCDESGQLFIKPCTQQEIDFYTSAKTERDHNTGRLKHEAFADVMPNFIGTLTLNDPAEVSSIDEAPTPTVENPETNKEISWVPSKNRKLVTDKSIVLDNASFGYKHPNILDVKLGVRLYADTAPKAKKERFDKISKETTHKNLGFRISGMRVYKGGDDTELAEDDYKIYDKDYGRLKVNDDNVKDALRGFVFNERAGIDVDHAKAVCAAFVEDLKRIRDALEGDESRMFSASCLFTFEGDGETLKRNIREQNEQAEAAEAAEALEANLARRRSKGISDIPSSTRVDSGIGLEEDEDEYANSGDDIDSDIEDVPAKIFSVQLIDFAHAKWVPGQGPDENSLLGVRSLITIFEELSN